MITLNKFAVSCREMALAKGLVTSESSRNLEWCLYGLPDGIEIFTEDVVNSKGKVIGKKAKFGKREITYKEV